ncbi:MAG: iron-containing alcohol dehydrogenase [Candidatus Izemoplasmatales bacterium]
MNNFRFHSPTDFIFGKDSEYKVGVLLKQYRATNVLIHYGGGSVIRSGLLDRVKQVLDQEKIRYFELGGVQPNPRSGLVYQGIEIAKKKQADFVLAIGGGSTIDSAKAIAAGSLYDGDFWDFYEGKAKIERALPIGVILTIPAAGSEGSTSAVITQENGMLKRGLNTQFYRPRFAIINPELTYTLPMYHLAAGIVDMMGHIFERYFTKTKNVLLTDRMSEAVLVSIVEAAKLLMKDPLNYEARATICWSATIAHNGTLGVGKEEDWATHGLEHELSALYDVAHGAGLAVMFPAYMRYTIDEDVERFRRLAVTVFGVKDDPNDPRKVASKGIDAMETFFKEIGMPTSFSELGADKDDIDKLIEKLRINRGEIFGSYKKLTMADAKQIYLLACK